MILSIQSHVAYGYVGNKAATYPLQSLGYDVCPVNTVQFSNHTGYGKWQGEIFSATHVQAVISGLKDLGITTKFKAITSGYLGDSAIGDIILSTVAEFKKANPDLVYLCDPVMGDFGRGVFVRDDIPDFFKNRALPHATIITPNHFEAELLYGFPINSIEDAKNMANHFHSVGVRIVVITSFSCDELPKDKMHVFLSTGSSFLIGQTPYENFPISPNGTGDLFSALFLGHYLQYDHLQEAFLLTLQKMYEVIFATYQLKRRELAVIGRDYKAKTTNGLVRLLEL